MAVGRKGNVASDDHSGYGPAPGLTGLEDVIAIVATGGRSCKVADAVIDINVSASQVDIARVSLGYRQGDCVTCVDGSI